jgi:hypothetical protein
MRWNTQWFQGIYPESREDCRVLDCGVFNGDSLSHEFSAFTKPSHLENYLVNIQCFLFRKKMSQELLKNFSAGTS